jgi:hypothetical protein
MRQGGVAMLAESLYPDSKTHGVPGLSDIGPHAALPVMEGKAMLFKCLGGAMRFHTVAWILPKRSRTLPY